MKTVSLRFPGGKSRAFTLSYDDGVLQDRQLLAIVNRHALKGTFNLNSGVFGESSGPLHTRLPEEEIDGLYAGQELGGHGLRHLSLTETPAPTAAWDILEDKRRLEKHAGGPMCVYAYPYGHVSDAGVRMLRTAGYGAARTVVSTHGFDLPADFLRWDPTCHHADPALMELTDCFLGEDVIPRPKLFYVWGHSYEFERDGNWKIIEDLCAAVDAGRDRVWCCTNGELYRYATAFRALEFSVDGDRVFNPSALEIWLGDGERVFSVSPGATVTI